MLYSKYQGSLRLWFRTRFCFAFPVLANINHDTKCGAGFPTEQVSNQSPQLHRLARKFNFTCSKLIYDTFRKANNKDADQTARMRRLVCACVVRQPLKTGFLAWRPKIL